MPKLLGGLFAFAALSVCILNRIDPWTATVRGLLAFAAGHIAGSIWEGLFGAPAGKVIEADALDVQSRQEADPADGGDQVGEETAA
ncbi:MAG: hypothetical protein JNM28_08955 [Armatimonadetes bacterium]|nr:hypothetical protein [Armatimonadota bacterium]MBS1710810.1 hypothetical protein [Armatimonadota bacterium]MBX3108482.1 hypothetical protein [Fimbriimonadaceae bacterium]